MNLNSKQKRAFQTVLSGLNYAKYGKKTIRFLTLTTSALCMENVNYDDGSINKDFQVLKKRIQRYSPYKLYKEGYISKNKMAKIYKHKDYFKKFKFEYFKVHTNEGNGVLHILYRGSYLPYNFLVDNWNEIHLSWDINIMQINLKDSKSASGYIVSQYIGNQNTSYVRSSQSWSWVYRGFKTDYNDLRAPYDLLNENQRYRFYTIWNNILQQKAINTFYPQMNLTDYG
jgi:hypothetical protein